MDRAASYGFWLLYFHVCHLMAETHSKERMFTTAENMIAGKGDIKLRLRRTLFSKAHATLVVVHGIGEHIGRYCYLEQWAIEQGLNCYLYDQRGHGLSEGPRGDIETFNDYVDDLSTIYSLASVEQPGVPLYAFGHSMGALVVLITLVRRQTPWQGAIVAGAPLMLAVPTPKWVVALARFAGRLFPRIHLSSNIDPVYLSHDPRVVTDYQTDPLVQRTVTLRWGLAFIDAVHEVKLRLRELNTSLLILHGEQDRVSSVGGSLELAHHLDDKNTTLLTYPGLYHELHNERQEDRNRVFEDIGEWLQRCC